jgi:hypothetical protein
MVTTTSLCQPYYYPQLKKGGGGNQTFFSKSLSLRERPFNLKGGLCYFSKKNILIPNVAEKNILILVEEKKIM